MFILGHDDDQLVRGEKEYETDQNASRLGMEMFVLESPTHYRN